MDCVDYRVTKIHLFASLARKNLEIVVHTMRFNLLSSVNLKWAWLVLSPKVGGARNADSAHF